MINFPGNLIRPGTLAQMAAEIEMDYAGGDLQDGGLIFLTEEAKAAWNDITQALFSMVNWDAAQAMLDEAREVA